MTRDERNAILVFYNLCNVRRFSKRLHERMMDGKNEILKSLFSLKIPYLQSNSLALVYVNVTTMILHARVVRKFSNNIFSLRFSSRITNKHA